MVVVHHDCLPIILINIFTNYNILNCFVCNIWFAYIVVITTFASPPKWHDCAADSRRRVSLPIFLSVLLINLDLSMPLCMLCRVVVVVVVVVVCIELCDSL